MPNLPKHVIRDEYAFDDGWWDARIEKTKRELTEEYVRKRLWELGALTTAEYVEAYRKGYERGYAEAVKTWRGA